MNRLSLRGQVFMVIAMAACASMAMGWQNILQNTSTQPAQKGAAMMIASQLNFRYDRTRVWWALTNITGFEAITGFAIEGDRSLTFTKIGDCAQATLGEQTGRLVVTALDPNRALRVVFETEEMDVIHTRRFVLATAGEGCVLQYWIHYTDAAENAEETAAQVRAGVAAAAVKFRRFAEPVPPVRNKSNTNGNDQ